MTMRTIPITLLCALCLFTTACVWVKPLPDSNKVQLITVPDSLKDCEHLGRTTAITKDKILDVPRNADTIQEELEALARNNAIEMGGDSLTAVSQPKDGRQTFGVYRCQKR